MSTVARSRSRYPGNRFGRRKARSVNLCTVVASLALADSVFAVQAGSVTATIYVGRHFEVRDHDQPTKYVFNGSTRVAEITGSLSSNLRVQRLRLYPGWNLCSLAVSGPFPASGAEAISAAYQWNSGTGDYSQIALGQSLAAGTVLWIKAGTNADVSVLGAYSDPAPQPVQAGGAYFPGAGLEAWSPALPDSASSWEFEPGAAQWSDHLAGDLAASSDPPPVLSPGEAFYLQATAPASLDIPDPTLRIRYYHQDYLGSSSVISDSSGQIVDESAYYPFGFARNAFQPRQIEERYQFTQKERDRETGLHYFEARYLACTLSRFVRADPEYANADALSIGGLSPQELNLYAYVRNDPLTYTDPTGLGWIGDAIDYASDNLWIPGRDSLSDLDVGRTAKVAGGVALAVGTAGAGLGVEFAVAGSLVAADQVSSGILDRPSYLHQAGTAVCGGNEQCGTTLEAGTTIIMGGAAAANSPVPTGPSVRPPGGPPDVVPPGAGTVQTVVTEGGQGVAVGARVGGKGASIIAVAQTGEHSASGIFEEAAYQADAARYMEYVNKRTVELAPQRAAAMEGYLTGDPNFPKGAGPIIKMIADEADIIFGIRSR
ncbi:MAG: RHS repeat-associated core domain-containing protein [Limisphaerales bacterium]